MLICAPQRKPTTADMNRAMQAVQKMRVAVSGFTCLDSSARLFAGKEISDIVDASGRAVFWKALEEDAPVTLTSDAVIEQHQNPAIVQRTNQSPEALLQRDHSAGNLIFHERVAPIGGNRRDTSSNHGIVWDGKRQAVDDHAAKLLALHIHSLPERRSSKQNCVR